MINLPHVAARVFGTPLMIGRAKLEVILGVLAPRLAGGTLEPLEPEADPPPLTSVTVEKIAVAVPTSDAALLSRIRVAQARLEEDGTLPTIRQRWTGSSLADQSGA